MSKILLYIYGEANSLLRGRWIIPYIASYLLIGISLTQYGVIGVAGLGLEAVGRLSAAIINVSLYIISITALVFSAQSIVGDREGGISEWVFTQPISRGEYLIGKYLGYLISLFLITALGYSLAGFILAFYFPLESLIKYYILLPSLLVFIAPLLSIGMLLSITSKNRVSSLGLAFGIWLLIIFIYDLALIFLAMQIGLGETDTFYLAILNPMESQRILMMYIIDPELTILGREGVYIARELGGNLPLTLALPPFLETLIPLIISYFVIRRIDMT
jgi:ABC-type transport system involved in multi-copper enzyme maturation permease subunit